MLENFIVEIDKPIKAIKFLTHIIQELMSDSCNFEECENQKLKIQYILSLVYTIGFVNKDMARLRREYYRMVLEGYRNN